MANRDFFTRPDQSGGRDHPMYGRFTIHDTPREMSLTAILRTVAALAVLTAIVGYGGMALCVALLSG